MAYKILSGATAVKASESIRAKKGDNHVISVRLDSQDAVEISACTIKFQGSETNEYNKTGLITTPTMVESSTDTDITFGAFDYMIGETTYSYAGGDFTGDLIGTLTVTATKWGGFNIYIDATGTFSAAFPDATPHVYASVALANTAISALSTPESKVLVAKVIIDTDAGDWVADTDSWTGDLTAAGWIRPSSSFTDIATHILTADEILNQVAVFQIQDTTSSWIRVYMPKLTGVGAVDVHYTSTEGY